MTPTHAAALASATDSLSLLKETLAVLPDEALNYVPQPGLNPLAVLIAHSISATRFLFLLGTGQVSSFVEYRNGSRAASFEAKGTGIAKVNAEVDAFLAELEGILAQGTEAHLADVPTYPGEDDAPRRSGALCLIHGSAHLREHVGQAELMRDLFLASKAAV